MLSMGRGECELMTGHQFTCEFALRVNIYLFWEEFILMSQRHHFSSARSRLGQSLYFQPPCITRHTLQNSKSSQSARKLRSTGENEISCKNAYASIESARYCALSLDPRTASWRNYVSQTAWDFPDDKTIAKLALENT